MQNLICTCATYSFSYADPRGFYSVLFSAPQLTYVWAFELWGVILELLQRSPNRSSGRLKRKQFPKFPFCSKATSQTCLTRGRGDILRHFNFRFTAYLVFFFLLRSDSWTIFREESCVVFRCADCFDHSPILFRRALVYLIDRNNNFMRESYALAFGRTIIHYLLFI